MADKLTIPVEIVAEPGDDTIHICVEIIAQPGDDNE